MNAPTQASQLQVAPAGVTTATDTDAMDEHIAKALEPAPPLSSDQRARLSSLLSAGGAA